MSSVSLVTSNEMSHVETDYAILIPRESSPTESPGHNPETPGNNFQKSRTKSVLKIDWRHFKTLQMTQAHVAY